jgi:hypothetical protein
MKTTSRISDAAWRATEATLPEAADRVHVRNRLEQIARDKSTPRQRALEQEKIAQACNNLVSLLLKASPDEAQTEFVKQLTRRSDAAKDQAKSYRKIKRRIFLRQCELLWLWQGIGGDLGVTTPRRSAFQAALHETPRRPAPHGKVIAYLQTAAKAVLGKSPSAWQAKIIVCDFKKLNRIQMSGCGGLSVDAIVMRADMHSVAICMSLPISMMLAAHGAGQNKPNVLAKM